MPLKFCNTTELLALTAKAAARNDYCLRADLIERLDPGGTHLLNSIVRHEDGVRCAVGATVRDSEDRVFATLDVDDGNFNALPDVRVVPGH